MTEFTKQNTHVYLDEETLEHVEKIEDYLKSEYDGFSDFVQTKLQEEQPETPKSKLNVLKKEKEELEDRIEHLKHQVEKQEKQNRLQELTKAIKQHQDALRQALDNGLEFRTREEIVDDKVEKISKQLDDPDVDEDHELVEKAVQHELDKQPDFDEVADLVKDLETLHDEFVNLNDGREGFLMDLSDVKSVLRERGELE